MSASRKGGAAETGASEARSNSARRGGEPGSTQDAKENAPGKSSTLTGTGQATLNNDSYKNQASSNIPMAEPSADINRSERLFPPAADTTVRKSSKNTNTNSRR